MDRNAKAVVPGLCCAVVRQLVGQGVFWLAVLLTGAAQAAPKVGEVPPTYVGVDAEGNAVDLFGFKGKVVVVTFWASWCGYCLKEIPVLENVQRQAGDGRIRVIAVNIDEIGLRIGAAYRITYVQLERSRIPSPDAEVVRPNLQINASGMDFLGFRLGVQYQPPQHPNLQLGLNYRHKTTTTEIGRAHV